MSGQVGNPGYELMTYKDRIIGKSFILLTKKYEEKEFRNSTSPFLVITSNHVNLFFLFFSMQIFLGWKNHELELKRYHRFG
jgi:hypothetical protein